MLTKLLVGKGWSKPTVDETMPPEMLKGLLAAGVEIGNPITVLIED